MRTITNEVFIAAANAVFYQIIEMHDELRLKYLVAPNTDLIIELEFSKVAGSYAEQFKRYVEGFKSSEFIHEFIGEDQFAEAPAEVKADLRLAISSFYLTLQTLLLDLEGSIVSKKLFTTGKGAFIVAPSRVRNYPSNATNYAFYRTPFTLTIEDVDFEELNDQCHSHMTFEDAKNLLTRLYGIEQPIRNALEYNSINPNIITFDLTNKTFGPIQDILHAKAWASFNLTEESTMVYDPSQEGHLNYDIRSVYVLPSVDAISPDDIEDYNPPRIYKIVAADDLSIIGKTYTILESTSQAAKVRFAV